MVQGASAPLDINEIAVAGERCIDKIIVQEETVTDESIECHHRLDLLRTMVFFVALNEKPI